MVAPHLAHNAPCRFNRLVIISPLGEAACALFRLLQRKLPDNRALLSADYDEQLLLDRGDLVLVDASSFSERPLLNLLNRLQLGAPDCSTALFEFPQSLPLIDYLRFPLVQGIYYQGVSEEKMIEGVRTMAVGRVWFPRRAMDALAALRRPQGFGADGLKLLTQREQQILLLMAQGLRNPQIAETLHLSPHTVKTHKNNLYHKIGVNSAEEAVLWMLGLNQPEL